VDYGQKKKIMVLAKESELLGQLDLCNPIQLPTARHNISINLYSREMKGGK